MKRHLVWFRNDLRLHDNPALTAAAGDGAELVAVYVHCPQQEQEHGRGTRQLQLIDAQLRDLKYQLEAVGVEWQELESNDYSRVPEVMASNAKSWNIDAVYAGAEVGVNEQQRDKAVTEALPIPLNLIPGDCVLPPGSVLTGQGDMFKVFTPFRNAWVRQLQQRGYQVTPSPWGKRPLESPAAGADSGWIAGEAHAHERLRQFCHESLRDYGELRDFPSLDATSGLSPYLAIGALSPRQCLQAIHEELGFLPLSPGETGFAWFNELVWREFYRHLMQAFPRVSRSLSFQPQYDKLEWLDSPRHFDAWCEGQTGYPIVDAAMRCLKQTGWMHNRLRMIVASFLTKDLQIDWRLGERWFMQQLVDADFASNNGGWQWAASTGADAAPYFRIFNPARQSEKFDAKGEFIRQWVEELRDVPGKHIHEPAGWLKSQNVESAYPAPIVDHSLARQQTLARYQKLKDQSHA